MTDINPQPRNMKAALAQLAGSRHALTMVMLELREARKENERLRELVREATLAIETTEPYTNRIWLRDASAILASQSEASND